MKNKILEKYNHHQPSIGTFTHLKSMEAIEGLGVTGLDYVVIDMEHSPVDIGEAARYITSAKAADITPVVRIPAISRSAVLHALDVGAMGIIVPCIETVEQVKQLVSYGKFQPWGNRGYCMTRDGQWGYGSPYENGLSGYMQESNRDALLIPQCETIGCLDNIEEIASIHGVDGIMVGPYDLSIAMGIPGQFTEPVFQKAIQRILNACKEAGKLSFIFTGNAKDASEKLDMGFDSAIIGLDLIMLIEAYKKMLSDGNFFK